MHARFARRLTALGLASTLLLAACGGSDEQAVLEDAAAELEDDLTDSTAEEEPAAEPEEEATEEPAEQLRSGTATTLGSVPDLDWTEVAESADALLLAPGVRMRVTQVAELEEIPADLAAEVATSAGDGPVLPADGEKVLVATVLSEDSGWEIGDNRAPKTEGHVRLQGSPAGGGLIAQLGSGERWQQTYLVSVPTDAGPEDAVLELKTGDATQSVSLVDGLRTSSDVEHIYQAGSAVTLEGDGAYSHVFDSWGSGTHEINGQVTGAVISPYVGGWARPGQVFLGLDLDARDDTGVDDDLTDLQLELPDGTTITPENDFSSLRNRFVETAWFQVPADSEQITLHVLPKAKAGTKDIDFESPVEVQLTIEGVPARGADSGDQASATEAPASTDKSTTTKEPSSTD
ncbi:hypothetical protein [Ornithinimicrobium murale]|uniref:hypothetical protein n=1 Tax=Ornithinimicrobium murale TaxID=1050153 RepID=UPI0013B41F75|nr:hypothetical protein [Ornithinimicrobium murale]